MIQLFLGIALAFSLNDEAAKYKERYHYSGPYTKLTDNRGRSELGYNLDGTRNMRVVLHGVLYRGGANNLYGSPSRPNQNPLPKIGLVSLCREGFATGVYLYSTNYSSAPPWVYCEGNELQYLQIDPYGRTEKILDLVFKRIKGGSDGPIYAHCWNGWHYSGLISAIALRQWCNYDGPTAVDYWVKNTDGNSKGYDSIKSKIRNFKPLKKYEISDLEKQAICP